MRILTILILLSTYIVFNSCNSKSKKTNYPKILIMIDFTLSIKNDIEHYKTNIQKIINQLPQGSHVVIGKICETTEASFKPIVSEKLLVYNFITDSDLDIDDANDTIKKRIINLVYKEFDESELYKNTNIISSLKLINNVFPDSGKKYLFLFSDMLHSYIDFNLEKQKIDDKFIEKTIEKLKKEDMLPDLTNVKIYVVGAKAKDDYTYNQIKKFWQRIFNECNAQLVHYSYSIINLEF